MSFASDHTLEQRTPIVIHHDTIKWSEAIPGEQSVSDLPQFVVVAKTLVQHGVEFALS